MRPFAARLTGQPFLPLGAAFSQQRAAVGFQLREAAEKHSPTALEDWAVGDLLAGQPDQAVTRLEKAASLAPDNASVLNDLAAARLSRAPHTGFGDAAIALASAMSAVRLDPLMEEARFNYALALEELSLSKDAQEAWLEYLRLDGTSPWSAEAQSHRDALVAQDDELRVPSDPLQLLSTGNGEAARRSIERDPQAARQLLEEIALPRWAQLASDGRWVEAAELLMAMRRMADLLAQTEKDSLLSESIGALEKATAQGGSSRRLAALVAGHRQYDEGRRLLQAGGVAAAAALLAESRAALILGNSPFVLWTQFQMGVCAYQESDYKGAGVELEPLAKTAASYPNLRGRALWMLGLGQGVQGNLKAALPLFEQALSIFQKSGEASNMGAIEDLIAEDYLHLGRQSEGFIYLYASLHARWNKGEANRRVGVLADAAAAAVAAGKPEVALLLQGEAIRAAAGVVNPPELVFALFQRCDTEVALGRLPKALEDLAAALRIINRIATDGTRSFLFGDYSNRLGRILRRIDPARAVRTLSDSVAVYREARYALFLPLVLKERALTYLALGRVGLAENDLDEAISVVGRGLNSLPDDDRSEYKKKVAGLFEEMILLKLKKGMPDEAFSYAERARAPQTPVERQLSAEEVAQALPPGVALIGYSAVGERLLIWLEQHGRKLEVVDSPISPRATAHLLSMLRAAISGARRESDIEAISAQLYAALVRPIGERIAGSPAIEILPEELLWGLPFGALKNTVTGRYLVEDHTIGIAFDATSFVDGLARARGKPHAARNALVVGDPAFSVSVFHNLPRLPAAAREAARVARMYQGSCLLLGEQATKERFLASVGRYQVISVAGHTIENSLTRTKGGLVFAGKTAGTAILTAADLAAADFSAAEVVVLSACGTASSPHDEGLASLARPIVAAGVPAVVASLWSVQDEDALGMITRFHALLRNGHDPATALRRAQLDSIARSGRSPGAVRNWAAFELIGSTLPQGDDR